MTDKKPRPRIRDKRQAILRAALKVFAEGGVNGVPMPVLAEQAQVGTGTIYRYFDSKEALVNELFREEKLAMAKRLYGDLDSSRPPKELFAQAWQRIAAFSREDPEAYRFLELQDHRPYLDAQSREVEHQVLKPIIAQYRALQRQGIFTADFWFFDFNNLDEIDRCQILAICEAFSKVVQLGFICRLTD